VDHNEERRGRKVVLYMLLSMDGVAEEPGDWLFDADEGLVDNLGRVIRTQDTVLLGRGTYDYWVGYWPSSEFEPFASFINATPKHVFTSTTPVDDWSASMLVSAPAVEYVADLKRQSGADIGVHGSISLAQSLLSAALVDELRLVVAPTIAGRGRRLFEDGGALQRFDLIDVDRTSTGILLLGYRKREQSPSVP
jgi:dihydrofolate reductase